MKKALYALIAVAGVALDQIVKLWARNTLNSLPGQDIPLWPGVFHLRYVENTGAAFGIFEGQRWIFLVLTGVVALAIIYLLFFRRKQFGFMPGIPVAFLLAGAVGNWIDRAVLGYVVDLFDFRLINFAVFNVADSFVVCSVIVIAAWMLMTEYNTERKKKDEEQEPDMSETLENE